MKVRSKFFRAVAVLLTLAMLLSLLPLQIFAVDPSTLEKEAIFKNMELYSAVNHRPISLSFSADVTGDPPDSEPRNYLYTPITDNRTGIGNNPLEWMVFAYSIQYSQDVDLELYKLDEGAATWENHNPSTTETVLLPFRVEEDPENPEEALKPEEFLSGQSLGYLKVYPYTENYEGPDDEGFYTYVPYDDTRYAALVNAVMNPLVNPIVPYAALHN